MSILILECYATLPVESLPYRTLGKVLVFRRDMAYYRTVRGQFPFQGR